MTQKLEKNTQQQNLHHNETLPVPARTNVLGANNIVVANTQPTNPTDDDLPPVTLTLTLSHNGPHLIIDTTTVTHIGISAQTPE